MVYSVQAECLYLPIWEKLPFAFEGKGLKILWYPYSLWREKSFPKIHTHLVTSKASFGSGYTIKSELDKIIYTILYQILTYVTYPYLTYPVRVRFLSQIDVLYMKFSLNHFP